MAVIKKNKNSGLSYKKEVREDLTSQLESVLTDFKKKIGEDEFNLRLKKAVKALTKNFKVSPTIEDNTMTKKAPTEEKSSSKRDKSAKTKSAKKKDVKAKHSGTPSKVH